MRRLTSSPQSLRDEIEEQITSILTGLTVTRLIAAFERRLEEGLSMKPSQYQNADWQTISADMLQELDVLFEKNRDRLFGSQGQIARELDTVFEKLPKQPITENLAIQLLGYISQGSRMVFDQKTHRQVWQRTTRLRYLFMAAKLLADRESNHITQDVLEHLEGARQAMIGLWGSTEWNRIKQTNAALSEGFQTKLAAHLGQEVVEDLVAKPLTEWDADSEAKAREVLGSSVMSEIYRQLLLSVISELWVDYLTRVEALRVSIGLEAYAQRDPLVAYKGRASELFGELLRDIRSGAMSRMFTYRPRVMTNTNTDGQQPAAVPLAEQVISAPEQVEKVTEVGGKKKRHRH
jgi:preprotein translocase subunit SecA